MCRKNDWRLVPWKSIHLHYNKSLRLSIKQRFTRFRFGKWNTTNASHHVNNCVYLILKLSHYPVVVKICGCFSVNVSFTNVLATDEYNDGLVGLDVLDGLMLNVNHRFPQIVCRKSGVTETVNKGHLTHTCFMVFRFTFVYH